MNSSTDGMLSIESYHSASFSFNVSHATSNTGSAGSSPVCADTFNAIISRCIKNTTEAGFWGGWMLQGANDYSITNFNFSANGFTSPPLSAQGLSSGLGGSVQPSIRYGGSSLSGTSTSSSLLNLPSKILSASNYNIGTFASNGLHISNGSATTQSVASSGIITSSGEPTFIPSSKVAGTASNSQDSTTGPGMSGFGTMPGSGMPANGTASIKLQASASSSINLGRQPASSNSLSDSGNSSSLSSGTGHPFTTVRPTETAANSTSQINTLPNSSSAGEKSGSTPIPLGTTFSHPLVTTLTALPSITLPPSRISIAPSGITASSEGVVFGGLLFSLSKSIRRIDLTIPTIKAEVIQDVDNIINKAKNLFDDLGGTEITDSCGGGGKEKRLPNAFTGLERLAKDITSVVGCADEVLSSLKDNLDKDTPDPDLIDSLLGDLSILADETNPDKDPSGSASDTTASHTIDTNISSLPSSTVSSATSSES
ncbi:hypothetical protein MMC12_006093 [Toensbergia leucococca]|nr:hypothetical protein [Toensbergia leucococca]